MDELRFIETFGIGCARRGWVESRHVVNALPTRQMLGMLEHGTHGRKRVAGA